MSTKKRSKTFILTGPIIAEEIISETANRLNWTRITTEEEEEEKEQIWPILTH